MISRVSAKRSNDNVWFWTCCGCGQKRISWTFEISGFMMFRCFASLASKHQIRCLRFARHRILSFGSNVEFDFGCGFGFPSRKSNLMMFGCIGCGFGCIRTQLFAPNKNGFGSALKPPNGVRWFQMQANRNGVEVCGFNINKTDF